MYCTAFTTEHTRSAVNMYSRPILQLSTAFTTEHAEHAERLRLFTGFSVFTTTAFCPQGLTCSPSSMFLRALRVLRGKAGPFCHPSQQLSTALTTEHTEHAERTRSATGMDSRLPISGMTHGTCPQGRPCSPSSVFFRALRVPRGKAVSFLGELCVLCGEQFRAVLRALRVLRMLRMLRVLRVLRGKAVSFLGELCVLCGEHVSGFLRSRSVCRGDSHV